MAANEATLYKLEVLLTSSSGVAVEVGTVDKVALRKTLDKMEVEDANAICFLVDEYQRGGKELVDRLQNEGKKV